MITINGWTALAVGFLFVAIILFVAEYFAAPFPQGERMMLMDKQGRHWLVEFHVWNIYTAKMVDPQ